MYLFATFLTAIALSHAYDENANFCIETEPLRLLDMEDRFLPPSKKNLNCQITAITLTTKEKESFINTMCKDHGGNTHRDSYHFFKLHNGELNGRGSYHDLCNNNASTMLAWLPYKTMLENYRAELNPQERLSYIAKATNVERQRTELCHFRHTDLVNGVSDSLFTCIVMIFEDNFYGIDDNINVLVELQPLMYHIHNITYQPWRNVTNSYKSRLGNSVLKNPSGERKPIYGSLDYSFVEKISLNTSEIYENANLERLPLLFEHRGSILELNADGTGGMVVQEKAYFGRTMDPKSNVKLQVIGQWVELQREFSADIYEYYGSGDLRTYKQELKSAHLTFLRIDYTEPVFDTLDSGIFATQTLFKQQDKSARLTANTTEWADNDDFEEGHPYPGFYPWFVLSCLIVGAAILVTIYGFVRSNNKKNKDKQMYELAKSSP